jgi:hypothetical protein
MLHYWNRRQQERIKRMYELVHSYECASGIITAYTPVFTYIYALQIVLSMVYNISLLTALKYEHIIYTRAMPHNCPLCHGQNFGSISCQDKVEDRMDWKASLAQSEQGHRHNVSWHSGRTVL